MQLPELVGKKLSLAKAIVFGALCAVVLLKVLRTGWVVDDAYITFRVLDNFVNGFGLRWNVDERVQVFTNPLWLFLHVPFYFLSRNAFLITICLSAVCGMGAVALLVRTIDGKWLTRLLFVLLPLWRSRIFCEQMISGLETPLILLLLAWFWYSFFKHPENYLRLFFIASLAMVNRLDAVVILFPALSYAGIRWLFTWMEAPTWRKLARMALSFWPILSWFVFALVYYGFILPNTYYAKMNTGISDGTYNWFGQCYVFEQFASYDSFSYLMIWAAMLYAAYVAVVVLARPWLKHTKLGRWHLAVLLAAAGMGMHLAYIISVGGDFIPGRFVMSPFFLSVLLIYGAVQRLDIIPLFACAMVLIALCFMPRLNMLVKPDPEFCRVYDERNFYVNRGYGFATHGSILSHLLSGHIYSLESLRHYVRFNPGETHHIPRKWPMPANFDVHKKVIVWSMVGVASYAAGPSQIVIDQLALGDPLLARLPANLRIGWRIAHFTRDVPPGYKEARRSGDLSKMPSGIRNFYQKLRLVTSGDLFSWERLRTIWQFQRNKIHV